MLAHAKLVFGIQTQLRLLVDHSFIVTGFFSVIQSKLPLTTVIRLVVSVQDDRVHVRHQQLDGTSAVVGADLAVSVHLPHISVHLQRFDDGVLLERMS